MKFYKTHSKAIKSIENLMNLYKINKILALIMMHCKGALGPILFGTNCKMEKLFFMHE